VHLPCRIGLQLARVLISSRNGSVHCRPGGWVCWEPCGNQVSGLLGERITEDRGRLRRCWACCNVSLSMGKLHLFL
jgi:hypothetical protein